jgi:hypothetical protein
MKRKPLPIGISDFRKLIEGGYAYVDKTLLIQEIIEHGAEVLLFPRMRRFGKTLNLSMLQYFFEKSTEDTSFLFTSMKIWQRPKLRVLQGKFPVIFLTLKDVKHASWQETFTSIRRLVATEFRRHKYLLNEETLDASEKEMYHKILREDTDQTLLEQSLLFLTTWLHRFHKAKVILLVDEYDAPAHSAFVGGYYDTFIPFLRNWLSAGLKDNKSLEKGVLTGILRIAKETIFSGLNNIKTCTILNSDFYDKFGLVEEEVKPLLEEYNLISHLEMVRKWYNGYCIGTHAGIYNPWSVINCIAGRGELAPYWVNTSENTLMKELITQGSEDLKIDLEDLVKGSAIEKLLDDGVVFANLKQSPNAIWSLLLFSGYLTIDAPFSYGTPCKLRIPNMEVRKLYTAMIREWFEKTIHQTKYNILLKSLTSGDVETFFQIFQEFLASSVSVFDTGADEPEKVYHAFVLGLLLGLESIYEVKSNRESGYGRYDVMVIPKNPQDLGIIFEFKKVSRYEKTDLESAAASALLQIEDKQYAQELFDRKIFHILLIGIAFEGKKIAFCTKNIRK